ncbi:MAG: mycothione reductase [Acidimicrobiia bacterium]|nr:mycothione reductase [Acidimicrobiia bacterium]
MDTFDLIIIGSGSGNSIPDHLAGWKIALVERGIFGGTCLNVGCIPSKMFVLPADLAELARHGSHIGVDSHVDGVDFAGIRDRIFGRIDPIAAGGKEYRASGTPGLELITGTARFTGDRTFDVDGRAITAPKVLLAAGARPVIPDIAGLADAPFHTSDTIMRLPQLPARLGVIGGGYIAVELGHVFSAYGSQVTMWTRSPRMLGFEDDEVSQRFTEVFARRVDHRAGVLPSRVETRPDGTMALHGADGDVTVVDQLLVATGRRPNSDLLDTAAGGIPTTDDGRVVVDDTMATPMEGVWALGDIANDHQLKHLANAEAKVAFWNLAHPDDQRRVDYRAVPHAIFGHPQVAGVGLTEQAARAARLEFVVGRRDYGGTAYGWALEDSESFAKVLIGRADRRILGAHVIGPQAATLVQPLIQAMQFDQTADRLAHDVFYIHPALTEVVENALLDGLDQLG